MKYRHGTGYNEVIYDSRLKRVDWVQPDKYGDHSVVENVRPVLGKRWKPIKEQSNAPS